MHFLCNECTKYRRGIDNYSVEPYGDHSICNCYVTPFVAAVLSICDNHHNWTKEKIEKGKKVVDLLLQHQADPHKKYVVDDFDERDEQEALKLNSYTIFQSLNEISDRGKQSIDSLSPEHKEAFIGFIKHLKQLSPSLPSSNNSMSQ